MVVAVSNDQTGGSLYDLRQHRKLVSVGLGHRDAGEHPRPAEPKVHPETVEGLFEESVLAESGFSYEARAAVGASEQASRQRHRISDGDGGVVRGEHEELLPEALLYLPEIGRLPSEGGAMHTSEVREEVGVVVSEVSKGFCVFVETQELTDDFDGEGFGIAERGSGSTRSETPELSNAIVDEAEDCYDKNAKIHNRRPPLRLVLQG
jgi:hypothetical protein